MARRGTDRRAVRSDRRPAHAATSGLVSGSSWPVTCRKSSSRSLAARAKLTIGYVRPLIAARRSAAAATLVTAEAELDRAVAGRIADEATSGLALEPGAGGLEGFALGQDPGP